MLGKCCPLCQTTSCGSSPKPGFENAVLLILGRAASLFLRNNSHMVGVDGLMNSPCEQDDTEQVFTKLADHGNGRSGDAELDTRSEGPISLDNSPLLATCWVFFWRCEKSGFWRTTFASGKEVTANLLSPWQRIPLSCSGQDIVALLLVGGSMRLPELNPLPIKPPHIQRGLVKALAEPHTLFLLCVILLKGTHWKILKHPLHLYNQTPFIIQIRPERFAAVFFIFK